MVEANKILNELEPQLAELSTAGFIRERLSPNVFKSDFLQRQEQAERDFVNAVLRQESGAAIAESEFESARKQYFIQPGDNEGVVAQKRKNRITALNGMLLAAGEDAVLPEPPAMTATNSFTPPRS